MPQRSNSNRSRSKSSNSSRNRNRSSDEPLMSQWGETAKDNPIKTAAVAAGAVAAGVFLWSKRNEISNQISNLSDQISDWAEGMQSGSGSGSGSGRDLELTDGPNESSAIQSSRATGRRTSASRSRSSASGGQANQTSGGRSQGQNATF